MATFNYIKQDGSMGTVEAADSSAALRALPSDANPHSGVMPAGQLSGTQAQVPNQNTSTAGTPSVQSGTTGSLSSFADALSQVTNFAKQKRNASSLGLMEPYRGTLTAGDFSSILSNINRSSDTTASELSKNALEAQQPDTDFLSVSDARALGVPYGTTKSEAAAMGKVPQYESSGGSGGPITGAVTSGNLVISQSDIDIGSSNLRASASSGSEADGKYADPTVYLNMYKKWIDNGGRAADFLRYYPYEQWINPQNAWLRQAITDYNNRDKSTSDLSGAIDSAF